MLGLQPKFGSLKPLRSIHNFNNNPHGSIHEQNIHLHNKNAPILNPEKKLPSSQLDKEHSVPIIQEGTKVHEMRKWIYELYDSASYEKASLYGFNIRTLQTQLKNNQRASLMVLWGLYQTLNWQGLSLEDLETYINSIPLHEDEVEEISIQNNKIKFNKLNMSLQLDLITDQFALVPKKHQLNRLIDREYQKSISKIVIGLKSYQFKGAILQIESNHLMVAVRTSTQLYIINQEGKMKTFNISTKDITVRDNRCYFAKINNSIGSIFIQTSYLPKLNEMALQEKIFSDQHQNGEFFVSNGNLTLIVDINIEEESIIVRKMQGQKIRFDLDIQPEGQQSLVNKKAFLTENHLFVLLFLGVGKNITKIISYKYFINC